MPAQIHVWPNILRPREGEEIIEAEAGQTLHQWMLDNVPGYSHERETHPVECLVNGDRIEPALWPTLELRDKQAYVLAVRPFGFDPLTIAYIAVAVAAAVAISSIQPPPSQTTIPDASPTYDINAAGNSARPMQPIPFACGNNRHNMDWLTEPWRENVQNNQVLYQLFSVGYGRFDLEDLYIGDTPAKNFQGVEIEICGPDDPVTLFPDNVDTSDEVGGIELFGPNEDQYSGATGPIVLVTEGQSANYLGFDFSCRGGLFGLDDDGDMYARTATVQVTYQRIDDRGNIIGALKSATFTYSNATNTPQRWTERVKLDTPGRYQASVMRINNAGTDSKITDSIHWEAARAYYPSKHSYPGITKIAVRVQASNNLSAASERKFNIRGTAMMPVWLGNGWSDDQPSRDIAWNFCNAIRSEHGGLLSEDMIDMDNVLGLHQVWVDNQETVNRVFDTRGTLLGALQEIAACGRAHVLSHNGKFFVVRDMQRMIRRSMYTPFDMLSAPTIQRTFPKEAENDSIIVEFWNESLSAMDEILCQLPNNPANNPKRIKLIGVNSREQAHGIGIFEAAKLLHRRMQIKFQVNQKGLNSIWGDRVGVSYWLKGWGASGEVVSYDGVRIRLSDPVTLDDVKQNFIALSREDGSFAGPYPVDAGADSQELILLEKPDFTPYTGDRQQRTQYQVGIDGAFCRDFIVTNVSPAGSNKVNVTALWDNPVVYSFQDTEIPSTGQGADTLPRPSLPTITQLIIVQKVADPQTAILSWQASAGANRYLIEHSIDGGNWARVHELEGYTWETQLFNGKNWFRVAAVGDGQGPWAYEEITLTGPDFDIPPSTVVSLQEPFTGSVLKVQWDRVFSAAHYKVEVIKSGNVLRTADNVAGEVWEYSAEQGRVDNSGREFRIQVTPFNAKGRPGEPAHLDVRNEPPGAPDNIQLSPFVDGMTITCDQNQSPDVRDLRLWASQTKGFGTSPDNLMQVQPGARIDLSISGVWYFRMAWTDAWSTQDVIVSGEFSGQTVDVDFDEVNQAIKDLDDQLSGRVDGVDRTISTLDQDVNNRIGLIDTDISSLQSGLSQETQNRSTALEEVNSKLTANVSRLDDAEAAITQEQTTRSQQHQSQAEAISTMSTTVGGHTGTIQEQASAIGSLNSGVESLSLKWGMKLDANGYISGFAMNNDGNTATALFRQDVFAVGAPGLESFTFAVNGNKVLVDGDFLVTGSVVGDHIATRTLTANHLQAETITAESGVIGDLAIGSAQLAGTLQSDNYLPGQRGWCIKK